MLQRPFLRRLLQQNWLILLLVFLSSLVLPASAFAAEKSIGVQPSFPEALCSTSSAKTLAGSAGCVAGAPRFALVVGESDYNPNHPYVGQAWTRLNVAERDATAIAKQLASRGFTLVDNGPQLNLDRPHFVQALQKLATMASDKKAIVLVYVSGHGFGDHGTPYVAPTDAARPILGVPFREQEVISPQDIEAALATAEPALQLIFFDACRDELPSYSPISGDQAPIKSNTVLGLAGEPGGVVPAPIDSPLSGYTSALVSAISTVADDATLTDLFLDADGSVLELSQRGQTPTFRYGDKQYVGKLRASAIFGNSKKNFAPKANIEYDNLLFQTLVKTYDFALSCYTGDGRKGRTPVPAEYREFMGTLLLRANGDEQLAAACAKLKKDIDRNSSRFTEAQQTAIDAQMSSGMNGLLKQVALDGDAHANFLVFAFVTDHLDRIFSDPGMFEGYMSPGERSAYEYLFRGADLGDPVAQLIVGQICMPFEKDGVYFTILPGTPADRYAQGRLYLERALDQDIGDAGFILSHNSQVYIEGVDTHHDKFRGYLEKALTAHYIIISRDNLIQQEYDLAIDYFHGLTGPKKPDRANEILRDIINAKTDMVEEGLSIKGLAAWRYTFELLRSHTRIIEKETPLAAEIRKYADMASDLGVKEAQEFVAGATRKGWYGYAKDPVRAEALAKKAASNTATSHFSMHLPN